VNEIIINEEVDEKIANDGSDVVRNGKQGVGAVNVTCRTNTNHTFTRFHRTLEERVRCLL